MDHHHHRHNYHHRYHIYEQVVTHVVTFTFNFDQECFTDLPPSTTLNGGRSCI